MADPMGSFGGRILPVAVVVVILGLPLGLTGAGMALAGSAPGDGGPVTFGPWSPTQHGGWPLQEDQPDPDNTVTRIDLADDGSAVWSVTFRTELATSENVSEYERFQSAFRANRSQYLQPFRERITGVVAGADDRLERPMNATAFAAETSIQEVPRRWGIVTFSFRWEGFGAVSGDRVTVGDVFEGGFFIGEDDALAIVTPEGYAIQEVTPEPDERDADVVEWRGREDFVDGRPHLVAIPESAVNGASGDDGSFPFGGVLSPAGVVGALVLLAVALLAGWVAVRERASSVSGGHPADERSHDGPSDRAEVDDDGDGPGLLTDEDRVRRLLADRGGRLKQSEVAEALDWSESKTSRVLTEMADEGTVEKLRLGRENVIDLADDGFERE